MEYKPVQYAKNDYRVLKKENRYTGTFMIRQKSNGFIPYKEPKESIHQDDMQFYQDSIEHYNYLSSYKL